jgi:hypothetical protein
MIETLLRHAPRDGDGEVVGTLIGLHGALRGYWRGAALSDEGGEAVAAVLSPVEQLLGRYRPRTLSGLRRLLGFIADDMAEHDERDRRPWLAAAQDAAGQLARLEHDRSAREAVPLLRLASPLVGQPYDSPLWQTDRDAY